MQARNTLQYKNYTCLVSYFNVKDCLTGRVLGMSQIPSFSSKTIEGIKEEFHKAVDNYITACKNDRKEPAKAFTGNYTIRTTPAIHEALALYAARQEVKFSLIMQQALNEFIKNHDIELPNKEET